VSFNSQKPTRGLDALSAIHCTIEEQVAMFLHVVGVVGYNQRFTCIKLSFRRSTETIIRHFQEVLYAVGELRNEMIVPASSGGWGGEWNGSHH
jgi:hypothetical protein